MMLKTVLWCYFLCFIQLALCSYYKTLGLPEGAPIKDVKRKYRQLALKYHPDKNPDGAQKFQEITEAYEVLTGKREPTDKVERGFSDFSSDFGGFKFTSFPHSFGGFSRTFGGGGGGFSGFSKIFDDDDIFSDSLFGSFFGKSNEGGARSSSSHGTRRTCRTETVRVGNVVRTTTICT